VTAWKLWECRFPSGTPEVIDSGPAARILSSATARNDVARAAHAGALTFVALPAGQVPVLVHPVPPPPPPVPSRPLHAIRNAAAQVAASDLVDEAYALGEMTGRVAGHRAAAQLLSRFVSVITRETWEDLDRYFPELARQVRAALEREGR
jgi:hypothetical protein